LKKNGTQIGGVGMKNLVVNMVLNVFLKKHKIEKTKFHVSLLGNGLNKFEFETIQVTTRYIGT